MVVPRQHMREQLARLLRVLMPDHGGRNPDKGPDKDTDGRAGKGNGGGTPNLPTPEHA